MKRTKRKLGVTLGAATTVRQCLDDRDKIHDAKVEPALVADAPRLLVIGYRGVLRFTLKTVVITIVAASGRCLAWGGGRAGTASPRGAGLPCQPGRL